MTSIPIPFFTLAIVKNKAPAPMQITAEQLLREAKERDLEKVPPPPTQKIQDKDELRDYQLRKRKAFEDEIRKNRRWDERRSSKDIVDTRGDVMKFATKGYKTGVGKLKIF